MRDGEEPLHQGHPAVEVGADIGVGHLEVDRLLLVGRRELVAQQQEVAHHPVVEAHERKVEVEPPARVLPAEHDGEQRREDEETARQADEEQPSVVASATEGGAAEHGEHGKDRDGVDEPEQGGDSIERPVGVVDIELDRVGGRHGLHR